MFKNLKKQFFVMTIIFLSIGFKPYAAYANFDAMNEFNMDMIMDQGNFAIGENVNIVDLAEDTNFMNHENNETLEFFFNNIEVGDLNSANEGNNEDNLNELILNAFDDGSWTLQFNEEFNDNQIDIIADISLEESQSGLNDIMPSLEDMVDNVIDNSVDGNDKLLSSFEGLSEVTDADTLSGLAIDFIKENLGEDNVLVDILEGLPDSDDLSLGDLIENLSDIITGKDEPNSEEDKAPTTEEDNTEVPNATDDHSSTTGPEVDVSTVDVSGAADT